MAIERITKIIEPPKNERTFHGGLYRVYTKETGDWPWDMFKAQAVLLKFENEMLQQGIPEEIIEKHRKLVIDHVQDEQAMDGECE